MQIGNLPRTRPVYLFLICLLVLSNSVLYASATPLKLPFSLQTNIDTSFPWLDISRNSVSKISLVERNKTFSGDVKKFYFADRYNTNFTPENSGTWETTKFGKVWRLGLSSAGAYSLYLSLADINLNPEVSLYVYNQNYQQVRTLNLPENGVLGNGASLAPVRGDSVVLELNVPNGIHGYGRVTIAKLYHDRLNMFGNTAVTSSCDENLNCENGAFWQTEKRSVCKIITDGALCTGTLMANTSNTKDPYLLTSFHTIFDEKHAQEAIFIFNFEYPDCSSGSLNDTQTISGASLLATAQGLDYSLLRLNQIPPQSFNPYYAGWDAGENVTTPVASIHHPYGKPKQIAIAYKNFKSSGFNDSYNENAFWRVSWDLGFTEPGSSGAPLFDKQHRVIGTLTGGNSSCNKPGNDFFNKIGSSWNVNSSKGISLKQWLDSAQSGLTQVDGYDPYGFNLFNCNVAWNIAPNETLAEPLNELQKGSSKIAEKFKSTPNLMISSVFLNISEITNTDPRNYMQIKIWEGNSFPSTELYSQLVFFKDLKTGINEIPLDSIVKTSGYFFVGYEKSSDNMSSILFYNAANRGNNGASSAYIFNQIWSDASTLNRDAVNSSFAIGVSECYGRIYRPQRPSMVIYPNPANTFADFELPASLLANSVRCFDLNGREVLIQFQPSELRNRIYFNLPAGVYLLKVNTGSQVFHSKFIVSP